MSHDPSSVLTRPAPPPDRTVSYGDHPDQVIDVREPAAGQPARSPVVFIHGGFWRVAYGRDHTGPLAVDLARRGWPVAQLEFRRVGQDGGGWPGTLDDIRAGLVCAGEQLGGPPIVAGHSAGGHLALWAAGSAAVPVRGVLALAGVCDLRLGYQLNLGNGAVAALLGGGPEEHPDRYSQADPMVHGRLDAPVTLVHGLADPYVPVALSRSYAAATGAHLVELPDVEHFGLIDPEAGAWPAVLTALSDLAGHEAVQTDRQADQN